MQSAKKSNVEDFNDQLKLQECQKPKDLENNQN